MRATVQLLRNPKESGGLDKPKKLVLRVTYDRIPHIYTIFGEEYGVDANSVLMTEDEFRYSQKKNIKTAREMGEKCCEQAREIIKELGDNFTFNDFKREYAERCQGKKVDKSLFSVFAQSYIERMPDDKQTTRRSYTTAYKSLLDTRHKLKMADITAPVIDKWAQVLYDNGLSENTVRMYIREVKAIYNSAVKAGFTKDRHPFVNQKTSSTRRLKTIIKKEDLVKLLSYVPTDDKREYAFDIFKLILFLGGPNPIDIILIKNRDIQDNFVHYIRHKTMAAHTEVKIPITEDVRTILNKLGKIDPSYPDSYVLPVLKEDDSPTSFYNHRKDFIKKVNDGLQAICDDLQIEKFTTYNIRHTVGSALRDSGYTPAQIQKILGHATSRQTETYLDSICDDLLLQMSSSISDIGKKSKN